MGFRNWVTGKLTKTVEAAVEPVKQNIITAKETAGNKAGLLANGLRVAICLVIGWILIRDDTQQGYSVLPPARQEPNHIVINNYIREKEETK
jgi:hypothetical protein